MIIVVLLDTNVSVTTKVDLALESVSLSYKWSSQWPEYSENSNGCENSLQS